MPFLFSKSVDPREHSVLWYIFLFCSFMMVQPLLRSAILLKHTPFDIVYHLNRCVCQPKKVVKTHRMPKNDYFEYEAEISAQIKLIVQRLREERQKQRISQMDLSFKAGLSQNQVNYIEAGKRTPNLNSLLSICKVLEINPAVLFEPNDTNRQEARDTIIRLVSQFL